MITNKTDLLSVGTRVRTSDKINQKYANRKGTIVKVNHQKFDPNRTQSPKLKWRDEHIEYGVAFGLKEDATTKQIKNGRADAWFLPSELEQC